MPKDVGKFLGVSAVNMSLCIYKDRCFARHFGTIRASAVPMRSLSLWAARDLLTILCAFNVPAMGAKVLSERYPNVFDSEQKAFTATQLLSPCLVQIVTTPLHLAGLDIYNQPQSTLRRRFAFIRREYVKSLLGRVCRIFPAFGLGGIGNKMYLGWLNDKAM